MFRTIVATCFSFCLFASSLGQVPSYRNGLLKGEGVGQELIAETNGYPGPGHVLDLADKLKLTDKQRKSVKNILEEMNSRAQELGKRIVGIEDELNEAFKNGLVSEKAVREDADQIGRLRGRLLAVSLVAHMQTKSILTEEQVVLYRSLRTAVGK